MARRFSGDFTVRVSLLDCGGLCTPATYRGTLSVKGRNVYGVTLTGNNPERRSVDSSAVYDDLALATLRAADHDSDPARMGAANADWSDAGGRVVYRVTRRPA